MAALLSKTNLLGDAPPPAFASMALAQPAVQTVRTESDVFHPGLPTATVTQTPTSGVPLDAGVFVQLTGVWQGQSVPFESEKEATVWSDCVLNFSSAFKIQGQGQSQWRGETIFFRLVGAVDPVLLTFEIYKTHTGKFTNTIVYQGMVLFVFLFFSRFCCVPLRFLCVFCVVVYVCVPLCLCVCRQAEHTRTAASHGR